MRVQWTSKALSDLVRLQGFLAAVNKPAATRIVNSLTAAPAGLAANPRIGEKLEEFEPSEIIGLRMESRIDWTWALVAAATL